jgi:hypothetical protein
MAALLLGVAPMTAASAATHDVLTIGRVGGANVKVGAVLKASIKAGTKVTFLTGRSAGITCKTAQFTAKVTSNPKAPGTARESLTAQSFGRCSVHGISGATGVKSIKLNHLPYKTTIKDSSGDPVTVSGTNTTLTLRASLGSIKCTYKATITKGRASNASQTITFSKQVFKLQSGVNACPKKGTFTAAFGPVLDTSVHGRPHVFVN